MKIDMKPNVPYCPLKLLALNLSPFPLFLSIFGPPLELPAEPQGPGHTWVFARWGRHTTLCLVSQLSPSA